jgi:hypothetical protein
MKLRTLVSKTRSDAGAASVGRPKSCRVSPSRARASQLRQAGKLDGLSETDRGFASGRGAVNHPRPPLR